MKSETTNDAKAKTATSDHDAMKNAKKAHDAMVNDAMHGHRRGLSRRSRTAGQTSLSGFRLATPRHARGRLASIDAGAERQAPSGSGRALAHAVLGVAGAGVEPATSGV